MLTCIACGSRDVTPYRRISGHEIIRCNGCGLLVTKTGEAARKKYIAEKYSAGYTEDYKAALPKLHERFDRHMALIGKYGNGGKLLDVGCGTGYFLAYVKDKRPAWKAYGVEPSALLRRNAQKVSGVTVKKGMLDSIPYPDQAFDLVTCYDVLEHSTTLTKNLKELYRVLKPGGLLFIQSPNYDSMMADVTGVRWDWWCIPDHVLHFTSSALSQAMQKSGFAVQESYTYEDRADFLSNIRGVYGRNKFLKLAFLFATPFLVLAQQFADGAGRGGLHVVLARKV